MCILPRHHMIATSMKYHGDWVQMYNALRRGDKMPDSVVAEYMAHQRYKAITVLDPEYPSYLMEGCIRPPYVLYYKGDLSLLSDQNRILTVVGSREPTPYAAEKTRTLCRAMVEKGYILVSGLAFGIDTIAAEEGVRMPGHAIAVLGNGLDRTYPIENAELCKKIVSTGLLLSEYPCKIPPDSKNFPLRNRILAGLGKATFASEIKPKSGTSITVSYALNMNHDVGVLPFRSGEEYLNNTFVKFGGALIEEPDDLLLLMQGVLRYRLNFYK